MIAITTSNSMSVNPVRSLRRWGMVMVLVPQAVPRRDRRTNAGYRFSSTRALKSLASGLAFLVRGKPGPVGLCTVVVPARVGGGTTLSDSSG